MRLPEAPMRGRACALWSVGVSRRGGFTLIELAMVLAIVALISAMAIPRFGGSLVRARADQAARRVAADLELAQRFAVRRGASYAVVFDATADVYRMPGMNDPDHPASRYRIDLTVVPYEVDLVSADFGGNPHVIFDGYGVPASAGQVVLRAGAEIRTLALAAVTGRVSTTTSP
jgi:type II secretion system protein H